MAFVPSHAAFVPGKLSPTKLTPEVCRLCRGAKWVNPATVNPATANPEAGQANGSREICQRCGGTGLRTLRTK